MTNSQSANFKVAQPRYVEEASLVAKLLMQELGLPQSSLEEFEQIVKAASDKAGRKGRLAPPGSGLIDAHATATEQLNRYLSHLGWEFISDGHLRYCLNRDKNVVILYQNVYEACNKAKSPKNRSSRGIETERLLFTPKNHTLPLIKPTVWFLCASFLDGSIKAEISKPVPFIGHFQGFSLRISIFDQDGPRLTTQGTPEDNSFEEELGDFELPLREG